ncbi:DUF4407 domain-containing protein [Goodfellowiella coeruleoviolacea]|uniref:DUF4407 domain-containing protein n=1 Tax=Goodfellowiella coeruleoviolacea TaxID=334858 RepID=A0AAE3KGI5_9PSEU|nr:DUF4407 domain-containing protein [Goodfellowiella coeruleoviolacea]MCP2167286.1 protein of unknown function (DUF4407) [Goodfellowiella coeruleoviolacea]
MIVRRWLAALAGARHDVLEQTPVDRFRYVAAGGVLLTTSAVAAVSAAFALRMAVRVAWPLAIAGGLAWGVVILNLDRLLVIGMTRRTGWWRNILGALPRVALALLLGTVIATPLVLRIFQPEIDAELEVMRNDRAARFEEELSRNPRYAAIPDLERKLNELQALADRNPDTAAAADPAVVAAQQEVDRARGVYDEAQRAAVCEIDGTCGTRQPGVAEAARERQQARDVALADLRQAEADLATAKDKARDAAASASTSAGQDADRVRDDLAKIRQDRENDQREFAAASRQDGGLLARIEALASLGDKRPDLWFAQFVLSLLFMSLELLPVLTKLIQLSGPPTVYDQIIERMDDEATRASARAAAREQQIVDSYAEYQAALEHDQAERQFDAGRRANQLLVAEQEAIAERAIRRWAQEAHRRSDRELDEWFHRNGDARHNPAPGPRPWTPDDTIPFHRPRPD